jgi:ABC-type transport system involved in cytochrome c biogenesis permease subunit
MSMPSVRLSAIALFAALVLAVFLSPLAKSQIQATPSYVPVGVSSSGATSTVWFHEPSSRQTLACQTVSSASAGLSSIHCVAAKLP